MLDYRESETVSELRARLRSLVGANIPSDFLGAFTDDKADEELVRRFSRILGEQRLFALAWPEEWGGGGADAASQTALREEMWAVHEPRGAQYMALNWVGPALMRYGTPDQQSRHLPPIAGGETVWCQGFSEPDAGSDLPALRTRAEKVDGGWKITGQKVWTSYPAMASWCFLLARTGEPDSRKDGITVFLMKMDQPGIEIRPIPALLGPHHINEVFIDGAFVPDDDVLGDINGGWEIVLQVIAFERIGIARYARSERLLTWVREFYADDWESFPDSLRERWAVALIHSRQTRLLANKVVENLEKDKVGPIDSAPYRIAVTLLDQEVAEVLADFVGSSLLGTGDTSRVFERAVEDHWRYAQAATVASGTIEMQRIQLAKHLLGKS